MRDDVFNMLAFALEQIRNDEFSCIVANYERRENAVIVHAKKGSCENPACEITSGRDFITGLWNNYLPSAGWPVRIAGFGGAAANTGFDAALEIYVDRVQEFALLLNTQLDALEEVRSHVCEIAPDAVVVDYWANYQIGLIRCDEADASALENSGAKLILKSQYSFRWDAPGNRTMPRSKAPYGDVVISETGCISLTETINFVKQNPAASAIPEDHPKHSFVSAEEYNRVGYMDMFLNANAYAKKLEKWGLDTSEVEDMLELFVLPLPTAVQQVKNWMWIGQHHVQGIAAEPPFGILDARPAFPKGVITAYEAMAFLTHCKAIRRLLPSPRFHSFLPTEEAQRRNYILCAYSRARIENTASGFSLTDEQVRDLGHTMYVSVGFIPGWFQELMRLDLPESGLSNLY